MIAAESVAAPRELIALGVGALLLAVYGWRVAIGKDPLRCGPSPEAKFTFLDALAIYLVALIASVLLMGLGAQLWPGDRGSQILFAYIGPVSLALVAHRVYLRRDPPHGPRVRGAVSGVLAWLAWFPVVFAVYAATKVLWDAAGWKWADQEILLQMRSIDAWKFFLAAVVCAPLYEETVFRGMIYGSLSRRFGRWAAIVVTSVLFALVHLNWVDPNFGPLLALFVLSLALTWAYERTGTLAAPIAFHAAFNGWTFLSEMLNAGAS